ncbi:hypothetical protein BD410DRAFT_785135 [Rickenella mellea]|uniref:Uncharacterized protein n=1 Tax=Rickenella mellea TaxID=50990 RepID=A0A4Y7QDU3_9AGAM|nr:hypothetical protein BD410DRAFT_785135 [Rickenella mellea]
MSFGNPQRLPDDPEVLRRQEFLKRLEHQQFGSPGGGIRGGGTSLPIPGRFRWSYHPASRSEPLAPVTSHLTVPRLTPLPSHTADPNSGIVPSWHNQGQGKWQDVQTTSHNGNWTGAEGLPVPGQPGILDPLIPLDSRTVHESIDARRSMHTGVVPPGQPQPITPPQHHTAPHKRGETKIPFIPASILMEPRLERRSSSCYPLYGWDMSKPVEQHYQEMQHVGIWEWDRMQYLTTPGCHTVFFSFKALPWFGMNHVRTSKYDPPFLTVGALIYRISLHLHALRRLAGPPAYFRLIDGLFKSKKFYFHYADISPIDQLPGVTYCQIHTISRSDFVLNRR